MALADPHSYADDTQPRTRHLDLDLDFDFRARDLGGTVTLTLETPASGTLDLDTRGLAIQSVTDGAGEPVAFELAAPDPIRGSRLRLSLRGDRATIRYRTSPDASALQWLSPAQTRGGRQPYIYTQCQAIHARSVLPCQDTPRVRSRYRASLTIPAALRAVMAAAHAGRKVIDGGRAIERFEMPQPIPSYLFALAVGEIEGRELGPRSRVYAEPEALDQAAWEFAQVDAMLVAAEGLFGPYAWDRFDLLVMPPSFPYGGMENPRLTFLTPTLLAGDRSLVNVVAHELAHSWTGNLVTNASMNDFWLNEGFTVYAERRILEVIEGSASVALQAALGRRHLDVDLARLERMNPRFTRLRNDLSDVHPDEVYSLVPYEKGYLFLRRIEAAVGRARFDTFLRSYIDEFRFQSITTDDFLRFLERELGAAAQAIDCAAWIDGPGVPKTAPATASERLARIERVVADWKEGRRPSQDTLRRLDATEWQVFLSCLPGRLELADCAFLDDHFQLTDSKNAEVRVAWLTIAAASGYAPAYRGVRATLERWGRMKYLRPLYTALVEQGEQGRALAADIYARARSSYHPVGRTLVEGLLQRRR